MLHELLEAEALDAVSKGFDWSYDEPYLIFDTEDGERYLFDRRRQRWFQADPLPVS